MESYFSDYIGCLLETGELPTLGSANGINSGICDAQYEAFDIASGRPPKQTGSGARGSSNNRSVQPVRGRNRRRGGRVSAGGGAPNAEGGAQKTNAPARQALRKSGSKTPEEAGESRRRGVTPSGVKKRKVIKISSSLLRRRGLTSQEAARAIETNKKRLGSSKLRRKLVQKLDLQKKTAPQVAIEAGWSFSNILRWFLIILIVIALILILGFQAMQVKKSMDSEM